MKIRMLLLALCCAGMLGCGGQTESAGKGGIWDETENARVVLVQDSLGRAVANAQVRWRSLESWLAVATGARTSFLDSGRTDGDGYLRVVLEDPTRWVFDVSTSQGQAAYTLWNAKVDSLRLTVHPSLRWSGKLKLTGELPDSLFLAGTSQASAVDALGNFAFSDVAPGSYALVGYDRQWGWRLVEAIDVNALDVTANEWIWPEGDSVVLEDFSRADVANRFHIVHGLGWWFNYTDSTSSASPADIADGRVVGDSAWQGGASLHVRLQTSSQVASRFALCGFDLEGSPIIDTAAWNVRHDLSNLDSVTFWAKGSGVVQLKLLGGSAAGSLFAMAPVTLTENWTRYAVRVSDFTGTGWDELATRVSAVNFLAQENVDLWLDQIVFHGVVDRDVFQVMQRRTQ